MDRIPLDPALTPTKWSKEKGIIAKLKTKTNETGITSALAAVQTAYAAIKWEHIDAKGLQSFASEDAVKEQMKLVAGEVAKMNTLTTALRAAEKQAAIAIPVFEKSKIIPKSSTLAVKGIEFQAKGMIIDLQNAMKTVKEVLDQLNEWAKGKAHGF